MVKRLMGFWGSDLDRAEACICTDREGGERAREREKEKRRAREGEV